MLTVIAVLGGAALIVFFGFRIIAQWVLPAPAYAAVARGTGRFFEVTFKLSLAALALWIVGVVAWAVLS